MVNAYGNQSFESKTNSFHFMYHIKNIDISNTFFCEIFIKMHTHAFFPRIYSITEAFFCKLLDTSENSWKDAYVIIESTADVKRYLALLKD